MNHASKRILWIAFFCAMPMTAHASLRSVLRKATDIADDVPLRAADDSVGKLRKLPIESIRPSKSSLDIAKRADGVAPADTRAVAVLMDGAKRIETAVPDFALRSDLMRRTDADALRAAGLRAKAADEIVYVDAFLQRSFDDIPHLKRIPKFSDFADVASDNVRWNFWQRYVKPHRRAWAASGALAIYLTNPEFWHDKAGDLTEAGGALIGDVTAEMLEGIIDGLGAAGGKVNDAVTKELHAAVSSFRWLPNLFTGVFLVLSVALLALMIVKKTRRFLISKLLQWSKG